MIKMLEHWNFGAILYVALIVIFTVMALRAMSWSNGVNRRYIELRWSAWYFFCLVWTGFSLVVLGWGILTGADMNIYGKSTTEQLAGLEQRIETVETKCKK